MDMENWIQTATATVSKAQNRVATHGAAACKHTIARQRRGAKAKTAEGFANCPAAAALGALKYRSVRAAKASGIYIRSRGAAGAHCWADRKQSKRAGSVHCRVSRDTGENNAPLLRYRQMYAKIHSTLADSCTRTAVPSAVAGTQHTGRPASITAQALALPGQLGSCLADWRSEAIRERPGGELWGSGLLISGQVGNSGWVACSSALRWGTPEGWPSHRHPRRGTSGGRTHRRAPASCCPPPAPVRPPAAVGK